MSSISNTSSLGRRGSASITSEVETSGQRTTQSGPASSAARQRSQNHQLPGLNSRRPNTDDSSNSRPLQASVSQRADGQNAAPPAEATPKRSLASKAAKALAKAPKAIKHAAERRLVSTSHSALTLGLGNQTYTGRPVQLAMGGGERHQIPAVPAAPPLDQVNIPRVEIPFSKRQQSKIAQTAKDTFQGKPVPDFPSLADCNHSPEANRAYISKLFGHAAAASEAGRPAAEPPALTAVHETLARMFPEGSTQALRQRSMMAEALATVTSPAPGAPHSTQSLERAQHGLERLHRLRFLSSDPAGAAQGLDHQSRMDALHIAQQLCSSGTGVEALFSSFRSQPPEHVREPLTFVIQTTEKMVADNPALAGKSFPDLLAAARAVANTPEDTLACKVLRASVKVIEANAPASQVLDRGEKTSVFTWRQGFHDEGKGTVLNKTQHRLAKFRKYVDRAENHYSRTHATFDPTRPVSTTASMISHTAQALGNTAQRAVGKNKNPLLGAQLHGLMAADLQHPHKDDVLLDGHLTRAMGELKNHLASNVGIPEDVASAIQARPHISLADLMAISDAEGAAPAQQPRQRSGLGKLAYKMTHNKVVKQLAKPFRSSRSSQPAQATQAPLLEVPKAQLNLAILAHWEDKSQTLRPQGMKLTHEDVRAIMRRLNAADIGPNANQPGPLPKQFEQLVGMTLDHAFLTKLGADTKIAMTGDQGANKESCFANAMRQANNILDPTQNKAESLKADDIEKLLQDFINEHNGGNGITFSDGGSKGINTGALSLNLTLGKKNGFTVGPLVDIRGTHTRAAVVSIGTSSVVGGEVFIGRQNQIAGQAGGGALGTLGFKLPKWLGGLHAYVGFSASTSLFGLDHTKATGVRMRFVTQRDEAGNMKTREVRAQMADLTSYMFECSKGEKRQMTPSQMWEDMANHFFDSKNLSVSWQDYKTVVGKSSATISGNARVGFTLSKKLTAKPGISLGFTGNKTWFNNTNRNEKSGNHPILRNDRVSSHEINMTVAGNITGIFLHDLPGEMHGNKNTMSTSLPVGSATFQLLNGGFGATFRSVMENGKFSDVFTVRDLSQRNVSDFIKMVNQPGRREELEQFCTANQGGNRQAGADRLNEYIAHVKEYDRPGQNHSIRSRIRSEPLADISAAWQSYKAAEKNNDLVTMSARMDEIATILLKPEIWVPNAMFSMHSNSKQNTTGLDSVVRLTAQTTTSSERELDFIGMPIAIADAWAQVTRNNPDQGNPLIPPPEQQQQEEPPVHNTPA